MRALFTFFLSLSATVLLAQDVSDDIYKISGRLTNKHTGIGLDGAHVINLNRRYATITDTAGFYHIYAASTDTLRFSAIGYQTELVPAIKLMNYGNLITYALIPKVYEIMETTIWGMTWNTFRDSVYAKEIPEEKWRDQRYIEKFFTEGELQEMNSMKPAGIPINYKTKDELQRLEVQELEEAKKREAQAKARLDHNLISRMTGYSDEELLAFIESLDFNTEYLLNMSEYDLIMELQKRYQAWEARRQREKN